MPLNKRNPVEVSPTPPQFIGEVARAAEIEETLITACVRAEEIIGMLIGDGMAEGTSQPMDRSLSATQSRNYQKVCDLRDMLDRIATILDPAFNKPKAIKER